MSASYNVTADHVDSFRRELIDWYFGVRRDMPWRESSDPYRIWLSEVMLQQTRVEQAEPYYRRFVERFPTVEDLARAPLDDVLLCWEGLGYYSRARNLHKSAKIVVDDFDGDVPDEEDAILSLPGVGPYTAAAVLSIAFDKPHAALDGNVERVLSRVFRVDEEVKRSKTRRRLLATARRLMDDKRPGTFNQALMELGATVCKPRAPLCANCPLSSVCGAARHGDPETYPVTAPRKEIPHYDVAVALIYDDGGHLLIQRRPDDAMLGGLWEFPGGKREEDESVVAACHRELKEELCISIAIDEPFYELAHAYSHFRITMHAFTARIVDGQPESTTGQPLRWVDPSDLDDYAFPRANRRLIERLLARSAAPSPFGPASSP